MPIDWVEPAVEDAPFNIDSLSESQQIRLTHVLDDYLQSLEQGAAFDAVAACRDEPALLSAVTVYLEKLKSLYGLANTEAGTSNAVPHSLGAFTLIREIGRGGMGIVYEASQAGMDRRVALKLLPLAATLDERQITRFQNESRAAGSLHHPNIVPVYSVGEAEGVHYYAMQLIEGTSVDAWIHDRIAARDHSKHPSLLCSGEILSGPRSTSRASSPASQAGNPPLDDWRWICHRAVDAAEALHSAHEAGVVHRDVKPSNLMLDRGGKIWITDFGLARCQFSGSLTRSGDVVGTMRYMSPEQAKGQSALVDGRTDVYSLASALYEMLSLHPAHVGDDGPAILKSIDQHDIVPIRQHCGSLPRDLETVISKAMSHSRDDRYQTAKAFADDLRRVLVDEPTVARPPTLVDRAARWASKHRRAVVVSMLVVGLGFVGFAISTARYAALKQVSDLQAVRAERGEQLARGAVDRLGSQMAELLADIPAAEPVRRTLLRETLHYYQRFAATMGTDPQLRQTLAVTHGKIGTLHDELGDSVDAIEALQRSERVYRELVDESPTDLAARMQWSVSQNNLAQSLQRAGRLEEAARYFAKAVSTQRDLFKQQSSISARLSLATSLNNLGLLLAQTEAFEQSEACYLDALELLQIGGAPAHGDTRSSDLRSPTLRSGVSEPTNPSAPVTRQLAATLANLSGLLADRDPPRAIEYARRALSNQTEALKRDRGDAKLATHVVVTLNTLGTSQARDEQTEAAIDTFGRAIEIGDQLIARWPDQPTYRRDLVISWNHLGMSLAKAGRLAEAREAFEHALDYQRPLASDFSSDAETHSMLGGVLNNLGFLHRQLGDPRAAADLFAEAVEHQRVAAEIAPEVNRYRDYLRKHKHNLAELKEAS